MSRSGLVLLLANKWGRIRHFELKSKASQIWLCITPETTKEILTVYHQGEPAMYQSSIQMIAKGNIEQKIMLMLWVSEPLELNIKLPIKIGAYKSRSVALVHNWSIRGGKRNVDIRLNNQQDLKKHVYIMVEHVAGKNDETDIFTNYMILVVFNKHLPQKIREESM